MESTGVIDRFLDTFAHYIDSGFGLIHGDVAFLASSLIVIDVTLAFLFWTWGEGDDIVARLVRKTLQVGFFAFLISNWNGLAKIIFLSFSGIGLKAAGSGSADDLLHPGKIAATGIDAARPLYDQATALAGPVGIFTNFAQIAVLLLAFAIVLLAFFIIAIQLFVTLIEFKLTTLAGFVLVPFGLFGRTAFLAERVLGNVMATGVKVLVLAVIIGIGSTIFHEFVLDFGGTPTLEQVASLALAALTLLGLAIFGPGIASGLISGGPQLGAGAAVATGATVAGMGAAATMGVAGAAGLAGRAGSAAASTLSRSAGSPSAGGSSSAPPAPPVPTGGAPTVPPPSGAPGGGGSGGGTSSGPDIAGSDAEPAPGGGESSHTSELPSGEAAVAPAAAPAAAPAWAKQLRRRQAMVQGATLAAHTLRSADHHGGSAHISLEDRS
ncbi:P-type conjugative transfer protein TrbL [Sphingomonas montanisoli]|uniref:P-type conjugative transfer protein TrbL n=1 Tax=Sphingomonas montanisoli TaxID=2606412 RepID=A0A5D9C1E7_9SPHN|nr:P-type conjugative transfer protein TrbL [Sphingomonas montanisoli]TZG25678.1 P-type conjugative transfer protein TrbL [Sphingomonas montanisoli]